MRKVFWILTEFMLTIRTWTPLYNIIICKIVRGDLLRFLVETNVLFIASTLVSMMVGV